MQVVKRNTPETRQTTGKSNIMNTKCPKCLPTVGVLARISNSSGNFAFMFQKHQVFWKSGTNNSCLEILFSV